jgi:sulfur-oxidizing protein SoxY
VTRRAAALGLGARALVLVLVPALVLGAGLLGMPAAIGAPTYAPTDDPETIPIWLKVRASLFGSRRIEPAPPGLLTLEVPARAVDAAVVPLAIRTQLPPAGDRQITRLFLLIDANPSPITAIFRFTPASGRAEVETRVRVDEYSFVRAIAETNDGKLYAVTRFVKASGGCSAPAGSDAQAAAATLGQMRFRIDTPAQAREPAAVQLAIQHPNHSGLAMDPFTRQFTPAHFVRTVEVSYGGQPVFSADVDFGISENPNFRFFVRPAAGAELRATVVDSHDRRFHAVQSALL